MKFRWTIYCHIHIDSGRRYIGLTRKTMMYRWNQHVYGSKLKIGIKCAHFWAAIRQYGKDAFSHEILEVCETLEAANEAEAKWISHFDSRNSEKGFNLAPGGLFVPCLVRKNPWQDPEYRLKLLASMNGRWSPELRAEASNTSKENWQDPEYRSKIGVIHQSVEFKTLISSIVTGRRLSVETRLNLSRKNSGKKLSLNTRGKITSSLKGRTHSEETRRKISEARRRQSISSETRAKIASSNTGKRHSDESRANMSIIQKKLARERINA